MYSFQSKSDWLIFILRRVKARLYIYSEQLSSIGTTRHTNQYAVNRDLETRYTLWPGINYPMYPRRVKDRLYI
jgi:hypothetical protein